MKKINQLLLFAMVAMITFTSCDDNEQPKGAYEHGVLVLNEGNFSDADGSISYYNTSTGNTETNVFSKANNGAILGDVVQSLTVRGDLGYVVVNNSNKVEVINIHTMESITSFEAALPRYMTIANGKGYLSEWGVDFADPKVKVIDLNNQSLITSIAVESGAEQIVTANGKVYVANSWTNTISVIDPTIDEVVSTITTDYFGISGLVVDGNDNIWGIYGGSYDWVTYEPNNDGAIIKINTSDNTVASSTSVGLNISSKVAINNSKSELYYIAGTRLYKFNTSNLLSDELVNETGAISFYGIGFSDDTIYVGDSKAFQGNGVVYRYTEEGLKIDSFEAGRGPNGFIFK